MKIELEVSDKNEGTASPWWMIIDPKQMLKPDVAQVAMGMVTGPFFSREEAEEYLKYKRYNFTKRAVVWCASGCYSGQYDSKYREADKKVRERPTGSKPEGQ